eukprot:CAMPEP_0181292536 /NCGR_PEP_ID=MMETSP1101-20121128/2559_1 /TAXON_ID=46948 /ORGANISM="Rhodomonas abbreviata, Strain Caron Lab Isolate" /LENGTH=190 /DNA_ID=CAMNT_0023397013 /DNA_START=236 /DNA_END=805 /DNA_ORIENTATION=-
MSFNSRGLSTSRIFSFLHLCALQMWGLRAHSKRDVEKSNFYFWGWVVYTAWCFIVEVQRLSAIETDAQELEQMQCTSCLATVVNATSCDQPEVLDCIGYSGNEHKSSAYLGGVMSLFLGLGLNGYFCLVARSYWYYLHDDRLAVLGQSVSEELTPLEQEALGGDTNVYVRMEGQKEVAARERGIAGARGG